MSYIDTNSDEYPLTAKDVARRFPEVSFPSDAILRDEAYAALGYFPVLGIPKPAFDPATQRLEEGLPVFADETTYSQVWLIVPLTEEEAAQGTDQKATEVRQDRDRRLYVCDFTMLPDSPLNNADWIAYRQALRDVPEQPGFPWEVVWPTPPSTKGVV